MFLEMWFSVGLVVGLNDLEGLFQRNDSVDL